MAKGAAAIIFAIVDREPPIDSSSTAGLKPDKAKGRIQLRDVEFSYPSRWVGGVGSTLFQDGCAHTSGTQPHH